MDFCQCLMFLQGHSEQTLWVVLTTSLHRFVLKVTKKETTVDEWFFTYPVRKPSERQLGNLLGVEHGDRKEVVNLKVQVFVHPCRLVYGSPKWFEITQLTI